MFKKHLGVIKKQHVFISLPVLAVVALVIFAYSAWDKPIHAATTAPAVHATNLYTDFWWPAKANGYDGFEWLVTPHTDPSPQGFFWSHQFWFVGGNGGYFGIQTEGSQPTGKIAIFSLWDATAAAGPQYHAQFVEGGTGYSVRTTFKWQINKTYHLLVARINTVATGKTTLIASSSQGMTVQWTNQAQFPKIPKGQVVYIGGVKYTTTANSTTGALVFSSSARKPAIGSAVVFSQLNIPGASAPYSGVPDGTWWGSWIWQEGSAIRQFNGQLKVPLSWKGLSNGSVVWSENYSSAPKSCVLIHLSKTDFTNFLAQPGSLPPSSHLNHLGTDVGCPTSSFVDLKNGVQQRVGGIPASH